MLKSIPFSQRTSGRPVQCWSPPLLRCGTAYISSLLLVNYFLSSACCSYDLSGCLLNRDDPASSLSGCCRVVLTEAIKPQSRPIVNM
ncbi:hypothetical protein EPr2_0005 [Providencia phage EPr2]|uniref:Uncharacterized protein n=1 Tax=Providencia phage EPr2 TaxID=2917333 RepID=A0AC61TU32_9CAUD|nr:hypothetical protein EPr2_0005 [Providencia phage EPr2]